MVPALCDSELRAAQKLVASVGISRRYPDRAAVSDHRVLSGLWFHCHLQTKGGTGEVIRGRRLHDGLWHRLRIVVPIRFGAAGVPNTGQLFVKYTGPTRVMRPIAPLS